MISSDQHLFTSRVENTVDPDQVTSENPADLDHQVHHGKRYHVITANTFCCREDNSVIIDTSNVFGFSLLYI